ncbi:MAG: hypothetical protein ACRCVJ_00025 [Clostridium sp.]|uniref:hypothetical protein n=1 Tax=Clostridium sp. TaxID=1506 RepID=UPI003F3BF455
MTKTIINIEKKLKYGVCNTSNVRSTRIGHAASVLAETGGLENGMIVAVGGLAPGETDIRKVSDPTKGGRIGIISSPEFLQHTPGRSEVDSLQDFHIPEGGIGDEYDLTIGDVFEISDNLIELDTGVTDLSKAEYLIATTSMKYKAVASLPSDHTGIVLNIIGRRKAFKNLFYTDKLASVQYTLVEVYVESM